MGLVAKLLRKFGVENEGADEAPAAPPHEDARQGLANGEPAPPNARASHKG